jgi:hypothetical protein
MILKAAEKGAKSKKQVFRDRLLEKVLKTHRFHILIPNEGKRKNSSK